MILLCVDLETTGTDIFDAEITEIGIVTFDTDSEQVVRIYSTLVKPLGLIPEEIQDMTGISQAMVNRFGVPWSVALSAWNEFVLEADYIVGHNIKGFDAPILERLSGKKLQKPIIDTMTDLPYERFITSKKLSHLALDVLGIANPFPHRAATDALTTIMLLDAYPIEEVIEYAKAEQKLIIAKLKKDDPAFDRKKDEIKRLGYRWSGSPEFRWQKSFKDVEGQAQREREKAKNVGVRITVMKQAT